MSEGTAYEFPWDPAKAQLNARQHDVTFDQAATVFLDVLALTVYDESNGQDEERWFTLGFDASGKLLAVAHTYELTGSTGARIRNYLGPQGDQTRAICLRKGTPIGDLMSTSPSPDDDMPAEIDFSGGVRGKFYRPDARISLPIYLEADVQAYLVALATTKGVPLSELANEFLKKEIAIVEVAK